MRYGRGAALFALAPLLAGDWDLWLDDAARPHGGSASRSGASWASSRASPTWTARARRSSARSPPRRRRTRCPDLGVGILAGGRPDLLAATLERLRRGAPGLLEAAHVCAYVNGPDEASRAILEEAGVVDRWLASPAAEAVGPATSRLALAVAGADGVELYLHLEDDWGVATLDDTWPARAAHPPRGGPRGGAGAPAPPQRARARAPWSAARRSPGRTRRACCGRARRTSRSTRS